MKSKLGYCCINMTLQEQQGITIGRGMIKKTFLQKGIAYASELALKNIKDLIQILNWNNQNSIKLYRMSSDMFPWMSEYEFKDLPDYTKISNLLKGAGKIAQSTGQRLTFHPGPFSVLASENPDVVKRCIKDLNQHGEIMDLLGLDESPYAAINVHINTTAPDKESAMQRFCNNFSKLNDSVKSRLVIENDDKESQYTVEDLFAGIYMKIGIPITFDYHHHWCHPGALTQDKALKLAQSTWSPKGIRQLVHFSSCKTIHEDPKQTNKRAHADYLYESIDTHGLELDIEIEAKAKEKALFDYVKKYMTT